MAESFRLFWVIPGFAANQLREWRKKLISTRDPLIPLHKLLFQRRDQNSPHAHRTRSEAFLSLKSFSAQPHQHVQPAAGGHIGNGPARPASVKLISYSPGSNTHRRHHGHLPLAGGDIDQAVPQPAWNPATAICYRRQLGRPETVRRSPTVCRRRVKSTALKLRKSDQLLKSFLLLRRIFSDQQRRSDIHQTQRSAALVRGKQILFPVIACSGDVDPWGIKGAVPSKPGHSPPAWCTGCTAP